MNMDILMKSAAAALTASVVALVIKQKNPELAMLLCVCTVVMILIASTGFLGSLRELMNTVNTIVGRQEEFTGPLIKCFAVGLITKISAELCTEASNRAAAAAVELTGAICAMSLVMPLLMSMLKMIGGML